LRVPGVIDENGKPVRDSARNLKTVKQGPSTSIWCATSPPLDAMGGVHCENADIPVLESVDPATGRKLGDSLLHQRVMPYAVDPKSVERLWVVSEQFVGLKLR